MKAQGITYLELKPQQYVLVMVDYKAYLEV